jgi:hypothetical protein
VVTGLAVIVYAAYLARQDKVAGAIPTFMAALALVVLGGPTAQRLGKFAVSEKGIEVAYLETGTATTTSEQARHVIATIVAAVGGGKGGADAIDQSKASVVAKTYYNYLSGLGFIPAPLVGSGSIKPGAVFVYQNGLLVLWANQQDAFPGLASEHNPSGLGSIALRSPIEGSSDSAQTLISCLDGAADTVSLDALRSKSSSSLSAQMDDQREYYVVTETLTCEGLSLDESTSDPNNGNSNRSSSFQYSFKGHVIVGYRLAQIKPAAPLTPST